MLSICVSNYLQARQCLVIRGIFPMLADPRHPVSAVSYALLDWIIRYCFVSHIGLYNTWITGRSNQCYQWVCVEGCVGSWEICRNYQATWSYSCVPESRRFICCEDHWAWRVSQVLSFADIFRNMNLNKFSEVENMNEIVWIQICSHECQGNVAYYYVKPYSKGIIWIRLPFYFCQ